MSMVRGLTDYVWSQSRGFISTRCVTITYIKILLKCLFERLSFHAMVSWIITSFREMFYFYLLILRLGPNRSTSSIHRQMLSVTSEGFVYCWLQRTYAQRQVIASHGGRLLKLLPSAECSHKWSFSPLISVLVFYLGCLCDRTVLLYSVKIQQVLQW